MQRGEFVHLDFLACKFSHSHQEESSNLRELACHAVMVSAAVCRYT